MFKRKYRVGKKVHFYNSRLFSSPFFTMKVKNNGLLYNRFLTIVSKKTEKTAVLRNRLKRVLASCLREFDKEILPGHDFIFILRKEAGRSTRSQTREAVKEVLGKAGFLT